MVKLRFARPQPARVLTLWKLWAPSTRRWQSSTSKPTSSSASTLNPTPPTPAAAESFSVPSLSSFSPSPHSSLSTFLAYADRRALSRTSTTYTGTYYEYLCQHSLRRLGFDLTRIGGRSDGGIDLVGTWTLPSLPRGAPSLRCVVQCKALRAKVGPSLVREVEGSFMGAPAGWRGDGVVGVLCATRGASKGVREAVRRSGRGLVWVMVEGPTVDNAKGNGEEGTEVENEEGIVRQVLWNQRVAELGAEGVGVGMAHFPAAFGEANGKGRGGLGQEVSLTWEGKVWEPEWEERKEEKVPLREGETV